MLVRFVRIRNVSGERQGIEDFQLAGGRLEVLAGEETSIPVAVYHRNWRRCHRWMKNMDVTGAVEKDSSGTKKRGRNDITEMV